MYTSKIDINKQKTTIELPALVIEQAHTDVEVLSKSTGANPPNLSQWYNSARYN